MGRSARSNERCENVESTQTFVSDLLRRLSVMRLHNIAVSPNIEYILNFQTILHNHNQLLSLTLQQAFDGSQIMS